MHPRELPNYQDDIAFYLCLGDRDYGEDFEEALTWAPVIAQRCSLLFSQTFKVPVQSSSFEIIYLPGSIWIRIRATAVTAFTILNVIVTLDAGYEMIKEKFSALNKELVEVVTEVTQSKVTQSEYVIAPLGIYSKQRIEEKTVTKIKQQLRRQ